MMKQKASEKSRQQQLQEKLPATGSANLVRRPALQQSSSAPKPFTLQAGDPFLHMSNTGRRDLQKPKAKPAAEAMGPAKPSARPAQATPAATHLQSKASLQQQASAKQLQQPEKQAQCASSESLPSNPSLQQATAKQAKPVAPQPLPGSSAREYSREITAHPKGIWQRAQLGASSAPSADTAATPKASLEPPAFTSTLLQRDHLDAEIPDWYHPVQQTHPRAVPDGAAGPRALDEPQSRSNSAHNQFDFTQQPGALSQFEILGHATKREPDAIKAAVSESLQKAELFRRQVRRPACHISAATEPHHIGDKDMGLASDPLHKQCGVLQQDLAGDEKFDIMQRAPSGNSEGGVVCKSSRVCMQIAPRDPRKAAGLHFAVPAASLEKARLPSLSRPVKKHQRDDSPSEKDEGRPAIKRPKTRWAYL